MSEVEFDDRQNAVPRWCEICGKELAENEVVETAFNAYTGEKLVRKWRVKSCVGKQVEWNDREYACPGAYNGWKNKGNGWERTLPPSNRGSVMG